MKLKPAKRLRRLLGLRGYYQRKRTVGAEDRWQLVAANLDSEDSSALDLGCNLGLLTRRLAETGRFAVGVDVLQPALRRAARLHREVPGLGFVRLELDPQTVHRLPEFDVVLCLSVNHYWAEHYGQERSWEMIGTLAGKARRKFFFEPASIRAKYGAHPPDIVDLDRASLTRFHLARLEEVSGPGRRVTCLGETPCIGPEPFRMMFLVSGP